MIILINKLLIAAVAVCITAGCGGKKSAGPASEGHARNVDHEFLSEKRAIEFPPGFDRMPAVEITFHDLREFKLDGDTAPEKLAALAGKKVALHGFVIPLGSADMAYFSVTKVPFNECYFCYPPGANEQVIVYNPEPPEFNVMKSPVRVTGLLDSGRKTDKNGFMTIHRMDAYSIEPISEDILPKQTREELEVIRKETKEIMDLQQSLLKRSRPTS